MKTFDNFQNFTDYREVQAREYDHYLYSFKKMDFHEEDLSKLKRQFMKDSARIDYLQWSDDEENWNSSDDIQPKSFQNIIFTQISECSYDIIKLDDDWFIMLVYNPDQSFWVCDGMDSLLSCIKNIYR